MSVREQIKKEILERSADAGRCVSLIKENPDLDEAEIIRLVHKYVCCKFFLGEVESEGKSLNEMAEMSIDRALELHLPMAKESERATTCGTAGSAPMKIALLLNALRKDLELDIEPHRLGMVIDTAELGHLIFTACDGRM